MGGGNLVFQVDLGDSEVGNAFRAHDQILDASVTPSLLFPEQIIMKSYTLYMKQKQKPGVWASSKCTFLLWQQTQLHTD